MSTTDYSDSWLNSNGNAVELPDSYAKMPEYFSSILKASQMASVESELKSFGHEDVTVIFNSKTDGNIRIVKFAIVVENWREHVGGESSYSRQNMVEYTVKSDSDSPSEMMHGNGSFFHKLENKISDIFHHTDFNRPGLRLDYHTNEMVQYSGTLNMHRYDNL